MPSPQSPLAQGPTRSVSLAVALLTFAFWVDRPAAWSAGRPFPRTSKADRRPRLSEGRGRDAAQASGSVPSLWPAPRPSGSRSPCGPSVSLAGIELLDQLLAGALGALVALLGPLLFLLQQARAGRARQHTSSFAVQAPQKFD